MLVIDRIVHEPNFSKSFWPFVKFGASDSIKNIQQTIAWLHFQNYARHLVWRVLTRNKNSQCDLTNTNIHHINWGYSCNVYTYTLSDRPSKILLNFFYKWSLVSNYITFWHLFCITISSPKQKTSRKLNQQPYKSNDRSTSKWWLRLKVIFNYQGLSFHYKSNADLTVQTINIQYAIPSAKWINFKFPEFFMSIWWVVSVRSKFGLLQNQHIWY